MNISRHSYIAGAVLALGAVIYVLFREPVVFTSPIVPKHTIPLPLISLPDNVLYNILKYQVPDALWCTALLIYSSNIGNRLLKIIAIIMPVAMEVGQSIGIIPGTFDIIDMAVYLFLIIIFLLKWKNSESKSLCLDNV